MDLICLHNDSGCLHPRQPQDPATSSLVSPSSSFPQSSDTSSQSESTSTFTPELSSTTSTFFTPSSTFQPTTVFSTAFSTSIHSLPTTTSLPPFPSEPPSSSTPPTSLSSGFVLTTYTSSFVSEINGSPTTIVTPIVTAVRIPTSSLSSSSHTAIIAGSVVAGIVIMAMTLATLFCLRKRSRWRQRYWALSRSKRLPSRPTLSEEEEMDLPFPSPPFASSEQPDPFATQNSSQRNSSLAGSDDGAIGGAPVYNTHSFSRSQSPSHSRAQVTFSTPVPVPSLLSQPSSLTPPRLLRARASESGSIFQESVWPPPSAASQLMDPLTFPSQSVDLTRVVTDVMGPPESGPLLLLQPNLSSQQGQGQEQEQGALNPRVEGERRGSSTPDNWSPRSESQSTPSPSPPSSPPRPLLRPRPESESDSDLSLRPPSTPWLSRPLNPSPKGSPSPLQRALPL